MQRYKFQLFPSGDIFFSNPVSQYCLQHLNTIPKIAPIYVKLTKMSFRLMQIRQRITDPIPRLLSHSQLQLYMKNLRFHQGRTMFKLDVIEICIAKIFLLPSITPLFPRLRTEDLETFRILPQTSKALERYRSRKYGIRIGATISRPIDIYSSSDNFTINLPMSWQWV
jgi:hypothetical protein